MNVEEIRQWLQDIAPTDELRVQVIKDLLENANTDKMSGDDVVVCNEALEMLKVGE